MAEARASSTDETTRKLRTTWKIGEKFPINFVPSVEGMVASTKWRDGVFSVIFVSPPYERQGGSWAEAALTYRTSTSLVKKPLPAYDFPFPGDPRICQEIIKAQGNTDMLQEVVAYMNKMPLKRPQTDNLPPQPLSIWETEGKASTAPQLPPPLVISDDTNLPASTMLSAEFMDKLIAAFSSRLSLQHTVAAQPTSPVLGAGLQILPRGSEIPEPLSSASFLPVCAPGEETKKRSKKKKRRSTSSSSSSTSSSGSSSDSSVGHAKERGGSGWFKCPFSPLDTRQVTLPRNAMQGKHEERKMLRWCLHTLYSNFTTLRAYVDTLKVDTTMSQFKPYNNDMIWLGHHATYLDTILLHSTEGPWKAWNELSIDFIARSFLELVVRASPTRKYPDILDEKVRKWMKRKRFGVSSPYGAIPNYLAEAKITEDGVQPKSGWTPFPKKDNRQQPFQSQNFKARTVPGQGGDKKPPV